MLRKKLLEYHYHNDWYNQPENKDIIDNILTPTTAKSSCWWSNLKTNFGGYKSHFDYASKNHKERLQQNNFENSGFSASISTAKRCPGILDLFKTSYLIKSPADMFITVDKNQSYVFNTTNDLISVKHHPTNQFYTNKNNIFEGKMNLKLMISIDIKTNNIPWLFLQPTYHNNVWFDVINGVVSGANTKGQQLNLNVLVDIPKEEPITYEIKQGDVLAYMWFPETLNLKHSKINFTRNIFKGDWSVKKSWVKSDN